MPTAGWRQSSRKARSQTNAAVVGVSVGVAAVGLAAVGFAVHKARMRSPVTLSQWRTTYTAADGSLVNFTQFLEHVRERGLEPEVRKEAWPYILGLFKPHEGAAERAEAYEALNSAFKTLLAHCQDLEVSFLESTTSIFDDEEQRPSTNSPLKSIRPPVAQLSRADVPSYLLQYWEAQRIIVMDAVRTDFKKNSMSQSRLGEAADGIANWISSTIDGASRLGRSHSQPANLGEDGASSSGRGTVWLSSIARHHLEHATHFTHDQQRQVERLVTLLSAYAVHDPTTGYCQGMSDLALPFLMLFEDDTLAFWCFERLMRRARTNFAHDDTGIFRSLARLGELLEALDPPLAYHLRALRANHCHFAYRMMVVLLRRELTTDQACRLWEQLWADDMLQQLQSTQLTPRPHAHAHLAHADSAPELGLGMGAGGLGRADTPDLDAIDAEEALMPASCASPAPSSLCPASPEPLLGFGMHDGDRAGAGGAGAGAGGLGGDRASPMSKLMRAALAVGSPTASPGPAPMPSASPAPPGAAPGGSLAGDAATQAQSEPPLTANSPLFMFFVAAVITGQRRRILDECRESDDVLRLFQGPHKIDLQDCLRRAREFRARCASEPTA